MSKQSDNEVKLVEDIQVTEARIISGLIKNEVLQNAYNSSASWIFSEFEPHFSQFEFSHIYSHAWLSSSEQVIWLFLQKQDHFVEQYICISEKGSNSSEYIIKLKSLIMSIWTSVRLSVWSFLNKYIICEINVVSLITN